ncbi:hypothetical protein Pf1_00787 [Flavobacterium columnare]|nr:hypothetical protein Pf1_00787 [Flavobacterium columnare]
MMKSQIYNLNQKKGIEFSIPFSIQSIKVVFNAICVLK